MTTCNNARPTLGTSVEDNRLAACSQNTSPGTADLSDTRPRCLRCGHPLTLPRSIARGYGSCCWRRTYAAQLDAHRDAVGRLLAAVARRVVLLDAGGLVVVTTALEDVLAGLDAPVVTL